MPRTLPATLLLLALLSPHLFAQGQQPVMPNMDMDTMNPTTLVEAVLNHTSSGTSVEPASTPMFMIMSHHDGWMLMLHGTAFIADTQQSALYRGGDKLFSTNWIMPMAQRQLGPNGRYGQLTLRTMLSLEPATITNRQYPELFQQGETAFGKP